MTKKQKLPCIASWDAADSALREIGERMMRVQTREAALNRSIMQLKELTANEVFPDQERIAALEEALEIFWLEHRKGGPDRSRALNFGKLGSRASRAVKFLRGWTMEKAVIAIQSQGRALAAYLRIKATLDREAVLSVADATDLEALRTYGVGIEDRETFFAEPDLERIKDLPAA